MTSGRSFVRPGGVDQGDIDDVTPFLGWTRNGGGDRSGCSPTGYSVWRCQHCAWVVLFEVSRECASGGWPGPLFQPVADWHVSGVLGIGRDRVSIGVSVLGRDRGAPPSLHHPQSRRQRLPPSPLAYLKAPAPEVFLTKQPPHTHRNTTLKYQIPSMTSEPRFVLSPAFGSERPRPDRPYSAKPPEMSRRPWARSRRPSATLPVSRA